MQAAEEPGDHGGQSLGGLALRRDGLELGEATSDIAVAEAAHLVLAAQQGLEELTLFAGQGAECPHRLPAAVAFALTLASNPARFARRVDGLVRQDLHRWGGGREGPFIYHDAKQSVLPLVALAWIV